MISHASASLRQSRSRECAAPDGSCDTCANIRAVKRMLLFMRATPSSINTVRRWRCVCARVHSAIKRVVADNDALAREERQRAQGGAARAELVEDGLVGSGVPFVIAEHEHCALGMLGRCACVPANHAEAPLTDQGGETYAVTPQSAM